jgi:hypothetical protein
VIFSRNRGSAGRHSQVAGQGGRHDVDADEFEADGAGPEFGPYDLSDAPEDTVSRLDLGALRIPTVDGVDIQLEAASNGEIQRVQLAHGGSRLQLGAFAAPRTEGIWDEIRAELRTALVGGGAKLAEVDGEYGPELQARFGGGQGVVEVRHVGIDGPRWFVHCVYVGAAAVDPDQAGPLREALRGLVVDRGIEARPVKEPLPLRLPAEAAAQLAEMVASDRVATAPAKPGEGDAATTDGSGTAHQPQGQPATPTTDTASPPRSEPATPSRGTASPRGKGTNARGGTGARGGAAATRRGTRGGRSQRTANEGT